MDVDSILALMESKIIALSKAMSPEDSELAKDLAQIGRIAIWHRISDYDESRGASIETFCLGCARSAMIDELRKIYRHFDPDNNVRTKKEISFSQAFRSRVDDEGDLDEIAVMDAINSKKGLFSSVELTFYEDDYCRQLNILLNDLTKKTHSKSIEVGIFMLSCIARGITDNNEIARLYQKAFGGKLYDERSMRSCLCRTRTFLLEHGVTGDTFSNL